MPALARSEFAERLERALDPFDQIVQIRHGVPVGVETPVQAAVVENSAMPRAWFVKSGTSG